MKTHTIEGQKMLEKIGGFMVEIGRIVRASHESWDGSGYPDGWPARPSPCRRGSSRRAMRSTR